MYDLPLFSFLLYISACCQTFFYQELPPTPSSIPLSLEQKKSPTLCLSRLHPAPVLDVLLSFLSKKEAHDLRLVSSKTRSMIDLFVQKKPYPIRFLTHTDINVLYGLFVDIIKKEPSAQEHFFKSHPLFIGRETHHRIDFFCDVLPRLAKLSLKSQQEILYLLEKWGCHLCYENPIWYYSKPTTLFVGTAFMKERTLCDRTKAVEVHLADFPLLSQHPQREHLLLVTVQSHHTKGLFHPSVRWPSLQCLVLKNVFVDALFEDFATHFPLLTSLQLDGCDIASALVLPKTPISTLTELSLRLRHRTQLFLPKLFDTPFFSGVTRLILDMDTSVRDTVVLALIGTLPLKHLAIKNRILNDTIAYRIPTTLYSLDVAVRHTHVISILGHNQKHLTTLVLESVCAKGLFALFAKNHFPSLENFYIRDNMAPYTPCVEEALEKDILPRLRRLSITHRFSSKDYWHTKDTPVE